MMHVSVLNMTKNYVLSCPPPAVEDDAKENTVVAAGGGDGEKIIGFSCPPRKGVVSTTMARKLSMDM
ncbi:hypothetical protein Tco_0502357 [Tanacetum coccineum]